MKSPLFVRYRALSLSLTLSLVPAFFIMEHVGPEGFPEAQGCSGAGNPGSGVAPPQTATIRRQSASGAVEVATDAFFLIDSYSFMLHDPNNIKVTVTTLEGVEVAGTVKVLDLSNGQKFYSWSASMPLTVGTQLKATVTPTFGAFGPADQAILEVVGAPTELSAGALSVENWLDYGHGVGPSVTCQTYGGCTGTRRLSLPGTEEMLHAATYGWAPAQAINGFVAWEITLERAVAPSEMALASPEALRFFGDSDERTYLGTVPFPLGTAEYCVNYSVRDLRTGEVASGDFCSEVGASTETQRDYPLSQCNHPPSAELTEAWCKLYPGSTFAECVPFDPTARPMPNDPMPQEPSDEPQPQAEPSGGDDMVMRSRTSSGCQMSMTASRHTSFALFVGASALAGLLRRRRAAR